MNKFNEGTIIDYEGKDSKMTPDERSQLAELLRTGRERLGLSVREVASRAGVDMGTVSLIENCKIAQPRADTIRAIADVVQVSVTDIYAAVHWLKAGDLPSFRPYMRSKYADLPAEALADAERYVEQLARKHGLGPTDGEDELPHESGNQ